MHMSKILSNLSINCLLITWIEKVGIEILNSAKAFIDYSQRIDDAYKNLEDHNPTKKRRVLIVFDYLIGRYRI